MNEIFLLKLGEIVLKGANKKMFENKPRTNVARRMRWCSGNAPPLPASRPVPSTQAFPLRGRCLSAHTGADEVAYDDCVVS